MVTALQRLKLHRDAAKMPVQKGRQKTAFPPNYIHSLDSSHMMLTALGCKREGASTRSVAASHFLVRSLLQRVMRACFDLGINGSCSSQIVSTASPHGCLQL